MKTICKQINIENIDEVDNLRNKFHQSKTNYEQGLRSFILKTVNNSPCCFEDLFKKSEKRVENRTFYSDLHPEELQVLEEMYFVKVNDVHKLTN